MPILTITMTVPQAARIRAAFGKQLHLLSDDNPPMVRDATEAEVKTAVIEVLKATVFEQESREAAEKATAAISPIKPT